MSQSARIYRYSYDKNSRIYTRVRTPWILPNQEILEEAPTLCTIIRYVYLLLIHDDTVRVSFSDLIREPAQWKLVMDTLRDNPPQHIACPLATPKGGVGMAATHRGIGPQGAIVAWSPDLVEALETVKLDKRNDYLCFVCIVTLLHEMRHWVRGVLHGWNADTPVNETYRAWTYDKHSGESGFLGESTLWGGILVLGLGHPSKDSNPPEVLMRVSSDVINWRTLAAVGISDGKSPEKWTPISVYKDSYVRWVVMSAFRIPNTTAGPFRAPRPGTDYVKLEQTRFSRAELERLKGTEEAAPAVAAYKPAQSTAALVAPWMPPGAWTQIYGAGPPAALGHSISYVPLASPGPAAPPAHRLMITGLAKSQRSVKDTVVDRFKVQLFKKKASEGDILLALQVPDWVDELDFAPLQCEEL